MKLEEWFLAPEYWPWFGVLPLLGVFLALREARRARRTQALVGARIFAASRGKGSFERPLRRAAALVSLAAGLTALLQPSFGTVRETDEQRGVDLMVVLDVSRSMLARDLAPDRLRAAQAAVRALTERARGDRFALVAFAGTARLVVPLTQDGASFADLVDRTDPLSVERGGTDLGAALDVARAAFAGRTGASEAVLLLTDGEDHEGAGLRAAEACRAQGIVVHCVGFGSSVGAKITLADERGESFLEDQEGHDVVSAMQRESLRRLAESTGGEFVDATTDPKALTTLYERRILPLTRRAFETEEGERRRNDYQWPLSLAVVLWLIDGALREGNRR